MSDWDFHLPTRVHFGWGRYPEAARLIGETGASRVFVMAGRSFLKHNGGVEALSALLKPAKVTLFDETEENPSIATVDRAAAICAEAGCQAVLAIGGGSVIDAAKAVAMLQRNPGSIADYLRQIRTCSLKGLFTVAVPTTSGTGSEVTPYSVITDSERQAKPAISFPQNFPDHAVVDPRLTVSMPKDIAVSTGLDALTQALEGFWSIRANAISRSMAAKAIVLIHRNLEAACVDKDKAAVEAVAAASNICGIQMAMVGNTAIHPLSYPFTIDHGVRHGLACAMFVPAFLRFNAPVLDGDFSDLLSLLRLPSAEALADELEAMMERLGAPTHIGPLGVTSADFDDIVLRGVGRSTEWNPRKVGREEIVSILEGML